MKLFFGAQAHFTWNTRDKRKEPFSSLFSDLVMKRLFETTNTQYTVSTMDSKNAHHLLNGPDADMFMAITHAQEVLRMAKEAEKSGQTPQGTPQFIATVKAVSIIDITKITQQAYATLLHLPAKAWIINADYKEAPQQPLTVAPPNQPS